MKKFRVFSARSAEHFTAIIHRRLWHDKSIRRRKDLL